MANTVEILITGKNLTKPEFDAAVRDARSTGEKSGANFSAGFKDRLGKDLPGLLPPVDPAKPRASGQATGQAFAGGMSPLILGAFAAIATVGPAAVLGATALAVIGAGALITKGNADLTASYRKLGNDAADAVTKAAQPLIPALQASVGVLDAGIAKTGPELEAVFAAVAPQATALTGGLVSLVNNTLPGMASGLRAMIPFSRQLGDDFGRIGTGLGGFFAALGSGASGGMVGFTALATVVEKLLPDIGSLVAALSNGLGPALHDIAAVALPVASGLVAVVNAFPPNVIRAAADAALALFLAFKAASLAGLVAEGTTFIGFLKAAAAGEIALTGETGILAKSMTGLGAAVDIALGPVGLLVGGLGLLAIAGHDATLATSGLKTANAGAGVSSSDLAAGLQSAAGGSKQAADSISMYVGTLKELKGSGASTTDAMASLDQQLARLELTDKTAGAKEYSAVLKDLGLNAAQGAAAFPQYAGAIMSYSGAVDGAAVATQHYADNTATALTPALRLISAVTSSQTQLTTQATAAGLAAVAALSFADAQDTLNTRISGAVSQYTLASGAAKAFQSAEDALFGKYADYSQAQATFTTDLGNTAKALKGGKDAADLNTAAGAANFTALNQLYTAAQNVADALIKQGGSARDATVSLQHNAQTIDDLARKAGFTKDQVRKLNIELFGVPTVKQITFTANTGPAVQALNGLIQRINSSSGTVQVYATAANPAGGKALGGQAHGGIAGAAATGGPRSNLTWVGEHGPELIPLQPGTMVHSNPDSMRMAAEGGRGGGGWDGVVRLEVTGDDLIAQWIRNHVRMVAGNAADSVQKAFGQAF